MEKIVIIVAVVGALGLLALIAGGVLFAESENLIHHNIEKHEYISVHYQCVSLDGMKSYQRPVSLDHLRTAYKDNVPLVNGSEAYKNWLKPSAPVYMQFWVFHVVNPEDILKKSHKPIVEERGPYTYREIRDKTDVEFSNHDTEISYKQPKSYVFEPTLSNGTEADNFTSVNIPILAASVYANKHIGFSIPLRIIINHYGEHLFENFTVGGYLWGYEEKTMAAINKLFGFKLFKDDKFGLFYGKSGNGTDDGVYVINSGKNDVNKINEIETWKGNPNVSFWTTGYCNMINGTDATIFHPFIDKNETLYIFSSDVCRSIFIKYQREYKLKGINLYRFSPPAKVFANHTENPDNEGFCIPDESGCLGSGVLNISPCKNGAPIILSQPHFYQGAKEYIDAITGMNPSIEHSTDIDIEPSTGVAMKLAKKLQINAMITKLPAFDDTANFTNKMIFPIVWLNESAVIGDDDASKFKSAVLKPIRLLDIGKIVLVAVGGVVLLICIVLAIAYVVRKRKDDDVPLINPGSVSGDE